MLSSFPYSTSELCTVFPGLLVAAGNARIDRKPPEQYTLLISLQ